MKEYNIFVERKKLFDQLPLAAPLGIHICASSYCNFKCYYCKHSQDTIEGEDAGVGGTGWLKREFMDMNLYKEIIKQLSELPEKPKLLQFAWLGEPLMNPNIAEMVKIAKQANVADTVSIVTNGAMLTNEMSDSLIEAGLDRLRISLQGLTAEDYWKVSNYKIDYEKYVNNIRYFFEHKRNTQVYIKIMDVMLKNPKDEELFQKTFSDICDILNVEHLVPLHKEVDISDVKKDFEKGYFGNELVDNKICAYCFYMLVIAPNGDLLACDSADTCMKNGELCNMVMGNVKQEHINDVWNGSKLQKFRYEMILKGHDMNEICKECQFPRYHMAAEDRLDQYRDALLDIYKSN